MNRPPRTVLRLLAWLALLLASLWVLAPVWAAPPPHTARIHFHRDDGRYEGWGLHVWGDGHALGADVLWTEPLKPSGTTPFGVYFDVPLMAEAESLNFIIHRGEQKSVATDQLLPLDEFHNEVWIKSGDAKLYAMEPGVTAVPPAIVQMKMAAERQPVGVWVALAIFLTVGFVTVIAHRRTSRLHDQIGMQTSLLAEARAELARQTSVQSEMHAQNRSLAGIDELTGLLTRVGFRQALGATQAKARRNRNGFALFYIDLDHFKPINDQHGHAAGDQVLRTVASRFVAAVRESDTVARLGGDEFVVIADELADPLAAARLAAKLVSCATEVVGHGDLLLRVAASIGVAVYPHDGEDDALIASADAAMYRAKNAGRNCFRFAAAEFDDLLAQHESAEGIWRDALLNGALDASWLELTAVAGGVWARRVAPCVRKAEGGALKVLPELVAPDAGLALDADLLLLDKLAEAAEAGGEGSLWILAPARSSLSDPRFLSACRGVVARLKPAGAILVLELDAGMSRPEGLADLLARGVKCGVRVTDPSRLRVEALLPKSVSYISLIPDGDELHQRAVLAVAAAARGVGVPIVLSVCATASVPAELGATAMYRVT
ncbi:hypothetical protein GCM10025771_15970 [Niveibacterium umoris]|uniref:Diguanylate cyclase (GGDEF)-like protein n=1 Tax=Niveibacterium umoris TaxID=1193620 RepID=A0A840BPH9_9RHOO|nr:diguanylate cyclase [Niveibacterium umoris]MBB4014533.1 diguanylate cyclase (GGDEF)-like protein [Niveibacterium umoris]